ncbi:MAG: hypothetical protein WD042_05355, partial [Phycisphaeraceae bacterium]
ARRFRVSVSTVAFWVERVHGMRLERADFDDGKPGSAWNRASATLESRILALRAQLRNSVLGECGAPAIRASLEACHAKLVPSVATINRVLARHGAQDHAHRVRRPPPPKGWYLPALAAGQAELDCFDLIEDLKIADGPLISVLTGTSLHGGLVDAWPLHPASAKAVLQCLVERWRSEGLPDYAQFDNDTLFQGAHQFADTVGRVSRVCLALGVVVVFAPPREPGFQNAIEGFNGLWQAKLWQRHRFRDLAQLRQLSARYIRAHRARSAARREQAPQRRPFPNSFKLDLNAPLKGTIIYLRRTDEAGRVHLLGKSFPASNRWLHRLVRCEVDFTADQIGFYALRRRHPQEQSLLRTTKYHRVYRRFQGHS